LGSCARGGDATLEEVATRAGGSETEAEAARLAAAHRDRRAAQLLVRLLRRRRVALDDGELAAAGVERGDARAHLQYAAHARSYRAATRSWGSSRARARTAASLAAPETTTRFGWTPLSALVSATTSATPSTASSALRSPRAQPPQLTPLETASQQPLRHTSRLYERLVDRCRSRRISPLAPYTQQPELRHSAPGEEAANPPDSRSSSVSSVPLPPCAVRASTRK